MARINYSDFRSGLTWQAVRDELTGEQEEARAKGLYMFVSRSTVLGRWHQHKLAMWHALPDDEKGDLHA